MGNKGIGKRRGFSLVEIIAVIVIIGIMAAAGINFGGKQIESSRKSTTLSNMRIVANEIEAFIDDEGFLDLATFGTTTAEHKSLQKYLMRMDAKYLSSPLLTGDSDIQYVDFGADNDFGPNYCGAWVSTYKYPDAWQSEMRIYYMIPKTGYNYRVVIASAGPNTVWARAAASGYQKDAEGNVKSDDDILLIMEPRQ